MEANNQLNISGQIVKVYPVKYTLNNLAVVSFVLEHLSRQIEALRSKEVKCRIYCIMLDEKSLLTIDLLEKYVSLSGFLGQNAKSQLVLHIQQIKFLDKGI